MLPQPLMVWPEDRETFEKAPTISHMYRSVWGKNSKSFLRDREIRQSPKKRTSEQCLDIDLWVGDWLFHKILLHRILLLNQTPQSWGLDIISIPYGLLQ